MHTSLLKRGMRHFFVRLPGQVISVRIIYRAEVRSSRLWWNRSGSYVGCRRRDVSLVYDCELLEVGDVNQLAAQQDTSHYLVPLLAAEDRCEERLQLDLSHWQQSPLIVYQAAKRRVNHGCQKDVRAMLCRRCELPAAALSNYRSHPQTVELASSQYYDNRMLPMNKKGAQPLLKMQCCTSLIDEFYSWICLALVHSKHVEVMRLARLTRSMLRLALWRSCVVC